MPYSSGEASFRRYVGLSGCTGDPVRTEYGTSSCDVYERRYAAFFSAWNRKR